MSTGRPGSNDPLREDFMNKAVIRHPDLTRDQVESTLISMRNREIQCNLPYVAPTDTDVDKELASKQAPVNSHNNLIQTDTDEELSEEVMLNDDGNIVPDTHFMSSVKFLSNPSSSKSAFDFRSSFSTPDGDDNSNIKMQEDDAATNPGPYKNPTSHKEKPQHSNSVTGSSAGDYINLFALLKIHTNVSNTMKKVSCIETSVTELNTKIDQKVSRLDSKLDVII